MEALDRSRTSSLEEVDSSEESEESLEQAAVASEADLSSSPWVRKTKCFLTCVNCAGMLWVLEQDETWPLGQHS